jgi:ketosteroid isomerase-like protein
MPGEDSKKLVEAFYEAWARQDIPGCLIHCDEVVRLSEHFQDPKLPFAGTTVGKVAFAERLRMIFETWAFERGDRHYTLVSPVNLRVNLHVAIRHLPSNLVYEGMFRHVWTVRNGRITQLEEYVDVDKLRAFLRLI